MRKHDMFYFAYSRDMKSDIMLRVCPGAVSKGASYIPNYRLTFTAAENEISAGLERSYGDIVYGVLWELGGEDDHNFLDKEHKTQIKQDLLVRVLPSKIIFQAFTYIPSESKPEIKPSLQLLENIFQGALEHGLPESYIADLKTFDSRTE
jgi:hypothetical protein